MSGHVLVATKPIDGKALNTATSKTALHNLISALKDGGRQTSRVVLPVSLTKAKITQANIGKAILVVRTTCYMSLYQGTTRLRIYRCAVGQPRYPMPLGLWTIIKKNPAPTWTNPYDDWSMGMPSFIGPGPNNPLGTRALYLNADGIRIHGIPVSENDSIGTQASHGCIRLVRKNVEDLYPLVPLGTPVYIVD